MKQKTRPGLLDLMKFRQAISSSMDGLWIGVSTFDYIDECEHETLLRQVKDALSLIKAYDRLRYDRVIRDLERIWVAV